jgi:RimJ/RimL family protein N-acetyltransferase
VAKDGGVSTIVTERLTITPAVEDDRARFTHLFGDPEFMAFSGGVLDHDAANGRFDRLLRRGEEIPFAKQPVRVTGTDLIIGYAGFDRAQLDGLDRLEIGWRLVPEARGHGFATEAAQAVLALADATPPLHDHDHEGIAIIDPTNAPSANVAKKVGFTYWKTAKVHGFVDDIFTRPFRH